MCTQQIIYIYDEKQKVLIGQEEYIGNFKDNKRSGQGKLKKFKIENNNKITQYLYEGEFKHSQIHGFGKKRDFDENEREIQVYEGNFEHTKRSGQGKFYNKIGGWIYTGEFKVVDVKDKNGHIIKVSQETGKGFLQMQDGTTKEGNFYNRQLNGKAILKNWDGSEYEGEWRLFVKDKDEKLVEFKQPEENQV